MALFSFMLRPVKTTTCSLLNFNFDIATRLPITGNSSSPVARKLGSCFWWQLSWPVLRRSNSWVLLYNRYWPYEARNTHIVPFYTLVSRLDGQKGRSGVLGTVNIRTVMWAPHSVMPHLSWTVLSRLSPYRMSKGILTCIQYWPILYTMVHSAVQSWVRFFYTVVLCRHRVTLVKPRADQALLFLHRHSRI